MISTEAAAVKLINWDNSQDEVLHGERREYLSKKLVTFAMELATAAI